MPASLYWYDLETFGRQPQLDRIAQFAGLRTDDTFTPLGPPLIEYAVPAPDFIPDPHACLVTGITPQEAREKGIPEYQLAKALYQEWIKPGTCVVGYNNIRFDDEFTRNLFYRNLFDPYLREYKNGNSRWDLINVVRAAHDLRPEGLEWPRREDGNPSFRLEEITAANGIAHENAHDALADVHATIAVAQLLQEKQPRLFRFLFEHRRKNRLSAMINLQTRKPLLHTAALYTRPEGCTTAVCPLAIDPANRNSLIVYDLRYSPQPLLDLPVEQIRRRLFTPAAELTEERIPLRTVALNKCPVLAPLSTLDAPAARRLRLDTDQIHRHARILQNAGSLAEKLRAVYQRPSPGAGEEPRDPDLAIYSGGFFPDADKRIFDALHETDPAQWRAMGRHFHDPRASELLRRIIGRSYPSLFNPEEQTRWKNTCATRLLFPPEGKADDFGTHEKKLRMLAASPDLTPAQKTLIRRLTDYKDQLRDTILAYHESAPQSSGASFSGT